MDKLFEKEYAHVFKYIIKPNWLSQPMRILSYLVSIKSSICLDTMVVSEIDLYLFASAIFPALSFTKGQHHCVYAVIWYTIMLYYYTHDTH